MIPFSVLDLVPVCEGGTPTEALQRSLEAVRLAERLGYQRYWVAEHHNMPGIASAATAVVIGHLAAGTQTIRVGSGGVMLPNHAPLIIAEQFGTLAALFPGRIDLGLGRAPGTDQMTARALRRGRGDSADTFPQDVVELQRYFGAVQPGQAVQAVPGADQHVPIWLLGSSLFSAQLAARLGLPFGFAAHFAPDHLMEALEIYRNDFRPSAAWPKPHAVACIGVYAADTDREAERLATSQQQSFLNLIRGMPGKLPPPVDDMGPLWSLLESRQIRHTFRESVAGSPATVKRGLEAFIQRTGVDELMVTSMIYDQAACLRSLELVAQVRDALR
ncbi:MAG: LLM class flavin-dependent oxidoreductase [Opitutaceae bacterium]|nr:LLM class flavin-dependent oxidoreductase [Opitutaceae bacterium]